MKSMYPSLLILLLSLLVPTNGQAQRDSILLKDGIQIRFEIEKSDDPSSVGISLVLKVDLENTTEDTIYILTNSCYGLAHFFQVKKEPIVFDSGISCTISYPTTQALLPKEPVEFKVYLYFVNKLPKKDLNIGLKLLKVPEKEAKGNSLALYDYKESDFEQFVFWKKIESYPLKIELTPLRR